MRPKNLDLIVAMIIAVMNVVWTLLPSHITVVGIILALPLVFVLPGYTLTEALFRKRSLSTTDRLIFSLGLSVAIDVVSGFILNTIGLRALSWAAFLGVLTVVFSLLVAYLRRGAPVSGARLPRFRLNIYQSILFGLAAAVVLVSIVYSITSAEQQPYPGFTQLWMLPAAQNGQGCAVSLGIHSFEATSVSYRVTMTMNEAQITTWPPIVLAPQQEWKQVVPVPLGATGGTSVEVRLYRLDKPQSVYREVHLTVHSVEEKSSNTCTSG
jgi:uncharacterized membrane protein